MAYSVVGDVQAEYKGAAFSGSTTPTSSQVTEFIAEADEEINSKIGLRYSVPVDTTVATSSALILKRLSVWLTLARVKEMLKVKTGDNGAGQDSRNPDQATLARKHLEEIAQGKMLLRDATLASTAEGMASFGYSTGATLTFDKDSKQW